MVLGAWYLRRPKEGVGSPETILKDLCELWMLGTEQASSAKAVCLLSTDLPSPNSKVFKWKIRPKYNGQ